MSFMSRIDIMAKINKRPLCSWENPRKFCFICSIILRAVNESGHKTAVATGRPVVIMTKKNVKSLKTLMDHKDDVSETQVARKSKCNQQYISKTFATKTTIRAKKKIKIPKRTDQQRAVARTKCRNTISLFFNIQFQIYLQ